MAKQKHQTAAAKKPSIMAPCTCSSWFQDAEYGKGIRLWAYAGGKGKWPTRYRCTVCLRTKDF